MKLNERWLSTDLVKESKTRVMYRGRSILAGIEYLC